MSILCTDDLCRNFTSLPLPSKIGVHIGQVSKGLELTLQSRSEKYLKSLSASSELDFTALICKPQNKNLSQEIMSFFMPEPNQYVKIS